MYNYLVKVAYTLFPHSAVRAAANIIFPYKVSFYWRKSDLDVDINEEGIDHNEFSLFSQNGEDGILRYIFSKIGYRSKTFLEFGFSVIENNCLRLVLKEGFNGLYIDGDTDIVDLFNKKVHEFEIDNVRAINLLLTVDNLEETILANGLKDEIDLLSIDVDGNDYWFWNAIECISPRVVIMEYNASYGDTWSATIPYDESIDRFAKHPTGFHHGASLAALEYLGKKKGYDLVYCDQNGVNAFFIRTDCNSEFNTLSAKKAYRPQKVRLERGYSPSEQLSIVKSMKNVDIP